MEEKKKILVVDDSALMRRVLCDIINSDERFTVVDRAFDGLEALEKITGSNNSYDAIVLDVNMPKMTGVELLKELKKRGISARIMMASTDTIEGAKVTMDCLDLGATDFVHKPELAGDARTDAFRELFLRTLYAVACSRLHATVARPLSGGISKQVLEQIKKHEGNITKNQVVAIACSTGGPKALQSVIPKLPKNLAAPVVLVQHMPVGFTKSLAERLDQLSEIHVKEAEEGEAIECGTVYICRGGSHMNVVIRGGKETIHYSDEPAREGVKPCANYMFESLTDSVYEKIQCVVLTGMGMDGTQGILHLSEKKKIHVIAQDEATCAVYGMPRSIVLKNLADQVTALESIAQEITMNVGVR